MALTINVATIINATIVTFVMFSVLDTFKPRSSGKPKKIKKEADPWAFCHTPASLSPARLPENYYEPKPLVADPAAQSFFQHRIIEDLSVWRSTGITKELVDAAAATHCEGESYRFTIVDGELYVKHITARKGGWFPALAGIGALAAKGRIPYTLLTLLTVLKEFPGEIPNLDAVLQLTDFPCIEKSQTSTPPPMFGFSTHSSFIDIPFPDHSFWGNENHWLIGFDGRRPQGWDEQSQLLYNKFINTSLADRVPAMMWRGRTTDEWMPERDEMRRQFVGCYEKYKKEGRKADVKEFDVVGRKYCMADACDFRYPVYLESMAYASVLRYRMVCQSVTMTPRMEFLEWYSRDMKPGVHYVELDSDNICGDSLKKAKALDERIDKGKEEYKQWKEQTAAQLASNPEQWLAAVEGRVQVSGANAWGTSLEPWEIAHAGAEFVRQRVSTQAMLLYVRDLLKEYGKLMRYAPEPPEEAVCYNGQLLLDQFSHPFSEDRIMVEKEMPWIAAIGKCRIPGQPEQIPVTEG